MSEPNTTCNICGKPEYDPNPEPLESWEVWLCDDCAGISDSNHVES